MWSFWILLSNCFVWIFFVEKNFYALVCCINELKSEISFDRFKCNHLSFSFPTLQPQLLLQIITKFAAAYCNTIEGTAKNIETTELYVTACVKYESIKIHITNNMISLLLMPWLWSLPGHNMILYEIEMFLPFTKLGSSYLSWISGACASPEVALRVAAH